MNYVFPLIRKYNAIIIIDFAKINNNNAKINIKMVL